jgi:hypothetical protein
LFYIYLHMYTLFVLPPPSPPPFVLFLVGFPHYDTSSKGEMCICPIHG